jgi:two-component system alkaline phosphatase synthesis response regulator PhoP
MLQGGKDMADEKKKILLVDDDEDLAKLVNIILGQEGYETAWAPNGKVGLEMVESFGPDLIILDVMMPELDGFAACKKLKGSEKSGIPVILLTGVAEQIHSTDYPLDGVLRSDAEEYLEKPVNPEEILEVVRKYLG